MTGEILLLGIAIFGLLIMFGQADIKSFYKLVIFLIAGPVLISIALSHIEWSWSGLSIWGQITAVLISPFLLAAILKALFPGSKLMGQILGVLFDTVTYIITFPFRLIWRSGRLIARLERHPVRLNPHRTVVGGRPPIVNNRQNTRDD